MPDNKSKILWVDDEIELLRPHILFLEEKGYSIQPATNAEDAISLVRQNRFDLVLLDEMMHGKDGLAALAEIKEIDPSLPVVMVTKNEEERLMEDAIGNRIDDYLTKPVNPSQILSTCKKILEKQKISGQRVSRGYISEFNAISQRLMSPMTHQDWVEVYLRLCEWDVELDNHPNLGLQESLAEQKRMCNAEFGRFIEKNYRSWVAGDEAPALSVDVIRRHVLPIVQSGQRVTFLLIDNLRLDQWLTIEPLVREMFTVHRDFHYSILPTATPYSRNAIFAGLFPVDIEKDYPEIWGRENEDEGSRNRNERQLLDAQLARLKVNLKPEPKYVKILDADEARNVEKNIATYADLPLSSIVVNFVDILAHSRSDSDVLREMTPDESAYRSLTKSWFTHSSVYRMLKELAARGTTVVLTSDHGSIRGKRGAKVIGDRETSTNLRYKYGRSLKCDNKHAILVKDPGEFKLPAHGININYLIAKEDYYFVYPTNYHHYLNYYKDSLQHGGASMEEMILPVVRLQPR